MNSIRFAVLLCAVALFSACAEDEPPPERKRIERSAEAKPEPAAPKPAPEPQVKDMPLVVMPEDTGVKPPANLINAFDVGQAALQQWCNQKDFACDSFSRKDMTQQGDHWVTQYFGVPNGQAMYVNVHVYPDGRAEVVRE
jgi:hypothetical protein